MEIGDIEGYYSFNPRQGITMYFPTRKEVLFANKGNFSFESVKGANDNCKRTLKSGRKFQVGEALIDDFKLALKGRRLSTIRTLFEALQSAVFEEEAEDEI